LGDALTILQKPGVFLLRGDAGAGKCSFLAELKLELQKREHQTVVFSAVGGSAQGATVSLTCLLRRLCAEIKTRIRGSTNVEALDLPTGRHDLISTFRGLLKESSQNKMNLTIFIPSVDRIDPPYPIPPKAEADPSGFRKWTKEGMRASSLLAVDEATELSSSGGVWPYLGWLPNPLPHGISLVLSSEDDDVSLALRDAYPALQEMEIQPLLLEVTIHNHTPNL